MYPLRAVQGRKSICRPSTCHPFMYHPSTYRNSTSRPSTCPRFMFLPSIYLLFPPHQLPDLRAAGDEEAEVAVVPEIGVSLVPMGPLDAMVLSAARTVLLDHGVSSAKAGLLALKEL